MGATGARRGIAPLVEQHYESLYRYAFRLSGMSADAEDLTQEAFCKAHTQLGQLRDPERAKPWLFSILRNAYLQRARSERGHREIPLEAVGEVTEPLPSALPEFGSEQLQAALNELPEGFRTPVILFYFEDMSYRDIAEQMALPIGTVMSRLARAKTHLKSRLLPTDGDAEANRGL